MKSSTMFKPNSFFQWIRLSVLSAVVTTVLTFASNASSSPAIVLIPCFLLMAWFMLMISAQVYYMRDLVSRNYRVGGFILFIGLVVSIAYMFNVMKTTAIVINMLL